MEQQPIHKVINPLLDKYAEILELEKALKAQKEDLQSNLIKMMKEAQLETYAYPTGTLSVTRRKKWKYSNSVIALEEKLKEEKSKEQDSGRAVCDESESVMFRPYTGKK